MSQPYTIRVLTGTDTDALRAMLAVFGEAFRDQDSYVSRQPDDAYLQRLLRADNFVAIAAFSGAVVIGGLTAYVLPKVEQARSELYIYDLAVDAAHRRAGVAAGMIDEARALAARRDIHVIFVQAHHEDDPAIALYTRFGVGEEVLHFDIAPVDTD
jgi:aminoglycoside 3-N-acetyltransferase I